MKIYQRWLHTRRRLLREAKRAIKKHRGNVRDAAAELGMPKSTLHDWLSGKVRV
jgi:transcriptional regulator of acetoin/glycerol metabolism